MAGRRGWKWDAHNSRLSVYVDGTEVARFDDATNDLNLLVNGIDMLAGTLKIASTAVTATAAEINKVADVSTRIVTAAAETLAVTAALHAGRVVLLSRAAGVTATLPEATGGGDVYTFKVGVVPTSNQHTIAALSTDTMSGFALCVDADDNSIKGWLVDGTDDKLELNGTTTGGLTIGDTIVCTDAQDALWHIEALLTGSGAVATPASAS